MIKGKKVFTTMHPGLAPADYVKPGGKNIMDTEQTTHIFNLVQM